jgi:hypothetical protein|tara:strand:- start:1522 stop:1809 length:288 start_codon:yes stop_codon:yes gene_type:complete
VISREVFLDHLIDTKAISYSDDESVVFAEKAFFAFRVAEWTFSKVAAGELEVDSLDQYWGLLSEYLSGEIDLKLENDVLYSECTHEEEYEDEEGC